MSSESSASAPLVASKQVNRVVAESPDDVATVDWSKPMSSFLCCAKSYMLQLILTAASGSFLFGINLSLLNTCLVHIAWDFGWCSDMRNDALNTVYGPGDEIPAFMACTEYKNLNAFLSTAVFIGAAIGSMTGGVFLRFGRRGMMLMSMVLFSFGVVSSVVAADFATILWARLVCGYGVGLISVVTPVYMSEMTPAEVRGKYGVFHQLFITVGILVGTLIGLPIAFGLEAVPALANDPRPISTFAQVWWRVMQGLGILPVILTGYLLGRVYTFETPRYYVEMEMYADAEGILRRVYNTEEVSQQLADLVKDVKEGKAAQDAGMTLGQAMKRADYRKVVILGCLFSAFQQFSGINVFMASSTALFSQIGLEAPYPVIASVCLTLINCLMTLPAVPLIEKLGRRTLMVVGSWGMTISVLPATICYYAIGEDSTTTQYLALAGSILFIIFFAATYGPVLWVYLFEIYPTEIKGSAAGLATAINWIAGIVMVFSTSYTTSKLQFLIFTIMCGIGAVLITLFMKETKGRELGDSPYVTK